MGAEFIYSVFATLTGLLSSIQSSGATTTEEGEDNGIKRDLDRLERLLKRIQATLYDAGQRDIQYEYAKLWLKEITAVAYEAEDILDECQYELLHRQIEESGQATLSSVRSRKRSNMAGVVPDGLAEKIKRVIESFEEVSRDRIALSLMEEDRERLGFSVGASLLPTGHMVNESAIFGLDQDKKKILELVLRDIGESKNRITVIPIVGIGGVGKTTLAQLVYNDPLIERHFDVRAWVYVSPDFDVLKITREILDRVFQNDFSNYNTLSAAQWALSNLLTRQKIFLVLDDVWNELPSKWEQFLQSLQFAESTVILVTTRNRAVAQTISTAYEHELSGLPEDQCISLFEHYAFSNRYIDSSSRFREIGIQIIRKCAGLPLAVKSIGTALGCKPDQDSWIDVLDSELWECDGKDEIFPGLKVSYFNLPPYVKPCLLFCSLFPKGFQFSKNEIIYMWIAHGYIQSRGNKSAEVLGNEIIQELHRRSFIQLAKRKWLETFTLHDLIHDLARSVSMGEFCTITKSQFDDYETVPIACGVRHLYLEKKLSDDQSNFVMRTIITNISQEEPEVVPPRWFDIFEPETTNYYVPYMLGSYICQNTNLRVLKWECIDVEELNRTRMANLKHLRYFELCNSELKWIHGSINLLYNLVTLKISSLSRVKKLPAHIGKLVNLRSLIITNVNIKNLPESVGRLANLQCLHLSSCPYINELPIWIGNLTNLRELNISNAKIRELPESFCMLRKLEILVLDQCKFLRILPDGFGSLINLRYIYILGSSLGKKLPESINLIHNLEVLELSSRFSVHSLVAGLKELLYKRSLYIFIEEKYQYERILDIYRQECAHTEELSRAYVRKNYLRNRNVAFCNKYRKSKCLTECLQPLENLVELKLNGHEGIGYPRWICANYRSDKVAIFLQCFIDNGTFFTELEELPSLKSLSLIGWNLGDEFSQKMSDHHTKVMFPSLESLEFKDMLDWNISVGEHGWDYFPVLQSLKIENCPNFSSLPRFSSLKKLEIVRCSFSEIDFDMLHWELLGSFHVEECINLTKLEGLESLNFIQTIYVVRCPLLKEFSYPTMRNLPLSIEIVECPSLKEWCQDRQFNYIEDFTCKSFVTSGIRNIMIRGDQDLLLEHLMIENSIEQSLQLHEGLCNLKKLEIKNCLKLETLVRLCKLRWLRKLVLWDCPLLEEADDSWGYNYLPPSLISLVVHGCHRMLSLDLFYLSYLTELEITNCKKLRHIRGFRNLKLESLAIIRCPQLQLESSYNASGDASLILCYEPEHHQIDCVVISGCPMLKDWCKAHSIEPLDDEMELDT